jgi:hypothetical protein
MGDEGTWISKKDIQESFLIFIYRLQLFVAGYR